MNELTGKRIMIVEDNPVNMAVFSVTLRQSGAIVLQDMWNSSAVQNMLERLPVDLIILDLMLRHGINGYDIFDELKMQPQLAKIPVIIVSAADPDVEIPRAKARGLCGFIGKPIKPYLFPHQIASCIEGNQIWYAQDVREEL